ncbi:hypothetical protein V8E51_016833 [Hyaloscypha variabilis]|uniref:Uncharacterized protein n=1 Tax=Hyaloscypha variabilis (strain UAMH 11265 / GT02V1 / F) TaxID=1149755 RepID=A0A2J6RJ06_HYAVF|nr:hypothetical protein L207DRAFT_585375 [Hyaloscypha variabilis F]
MPVSQSSHTAPQQTGVQRTAGPHPQQPQQQPVPGEQSHDSLPKKALIKLTSAFLKRRNSNKTVRWDETVIDNEKAPKVPSIPSTATAGSESVANTSAKMYSPPVQPPQGVRPSGPNTVPGPDSRCQTYVPRQQSAPSGRPQADIPSSQKPCQVPAANSSSKRRANKSAVEIRTTGSKSTRQTKNQTPNDKAARVPPAVPDAPQPTFQGPPPTPRITRLPTPDLPDLTGTAFCTCDDTDCSKLVHLRMDAQEKQSVCTCNDTNCNKSVHLKMNVQLESAKTYMRSVNGVKHGRVHRGRYGEKWH